MNVVKSSTFVAQEYEGSLTGVLQELNGNDPFLTNQIELFCFVSVVDPIMTTLAQQQQESLVLKQNIQSKKRNRKGVRRKQQPSQDQAPQQSSLRLTPPSPQELLMLKPTVIRTRQRFLVVSSDHVQLFNVMNLIPAELTKAKNALLYLEQTSCFPMNSIIQCFVCKPPDGISSNSIYDRAITLYSEQGMMIFITEDQKTALNLSETVSEHLKRRCQ